MKLFLSLILDLCGSDTFFSEQKYLPVGIWVGVRKKILQWPLRPLSKPWKPFVHPRLQLPEKKFITNINFFCFEITRRPSNPTWNLINLRKPMIVTKLWELFKSMKILYILTLALASLAASASAAMALWSWTGRRASFLQSHTTFIHLQQPISSTIS